MRTERPIELLAGRYALEEELGRSGTGVLWLARDTVLDRRVAVKVLRPELAEDPKFADRFADETRIAAGVHPAGLAELLDTGRERGVVFLIREHVPGESLRTLLDRDGPLPPDRAARLVADVLDAMAPAHRVGALHLDLKPENVIVAADGRARLTDLAVGSSVRGALPAVEAADVLAPAAAPPELRGEAVADPRADVFQAGALLFEALTGRAPNQERSPRAAAPGTPKPLDAEVRRALAPDPGDRHADADTFATALRATIRRTRGDHGLHQRSDGGTHGIRSWIVIPAIIAASAVAAIVAGLWLGRLEFGGPLGLQAADEPSPSVTEIPGSSTILLPVVSATAFDPFGDGGENDSGAPYAVDGDPATAWRSENYFDGELRKAGIGLLIDLGEVRTVNGFRLSTPHPGYAFGVAIGDDPETLSASADPRYTARTSMRIAIEPIEGRYVLLWITSVVDAGDGNRAEVAEFRVTGSDG